MSRVFRAALICSQVCSVLLVLGCARREPPLRLSLDRETPAARSELDPAPSASVGRSTDRGDSLIVPAEANPKTGDIQEGQPIKASRPAAGTPEVSERTAETAEEAQESPPTKLAGPALRMVFQNYDGATVPRNGVGEEYPKPRQNEREGGVFTSSIRTKNAVAGRCLQMHLTEGALYAEFNSHNRDDTLGFVREHVAEPAKWQFNTYNRMRFWIRVPLGACPLDLEGRTTYDIGTYVKRVKDADRRNDEAGGGHYYHHFNLAPNGQWTQVLWNMHPDHLRSEPGGKEYGNLSHPTGEDDYNYFDTLTRFYISQYFAGSSHPIDFLLDEMEFYKEPYEENDEQVYSLAGTYEPDSNRVLLTWRRNKRENKIKHEVRFAFQNIHELGWKTAMPAPNGTITPPGEGGYNGMVYDTTALPLTGKTKVYLAIKPENSELFSQIAVTLNLGIKLADE